MSQKQPSETLKVFDAQNTAKQQSNSDGPLNKWVMLLLKLVATICTSIVTALTATSCMS